MIQVVNTSSICYRSRQWQQHIRVLKNTAKAGNAIIGAGVYSAVLQHGKPYECKVIKIGNTTYDPWLDYIELSKPLGENCHAPLIHNMHIDHANEYYVATMEQLTH